MCLIWKERSTNMDRFSFHLVFFSQKIERSYTIHLNKNSKDLEIIRGDIHIRICKNPYHTSIDVLPWLCCMRPTKSQISLGTAHSYQRLCYEYKHKTFCWAWSGPNLSNISHRQRYIVMKIKAAAFMHYRLLCRCAAVPAHEAYIAHTAHPVLCTHFGFKKKRIRAVSCPYPTLICVK